VDDETAPEKAGYRRSAGSARGETRRRELLERVTDDLGTNGLVDFSLRRAARAAGTTHKVLLYYFDGPEDLLTQAVLQLRERRIDRSMVAAGSDSTLAGRVRATWPILVGEESWVLDQAIGLAMYDPARYAELARNASTRYLPALISLCPSNWTEERKHEVAEFILGTLRGFLIEWRTSGDGPGIEAGFAALSRALDREEAGS
jgi:AcrR family transcriptional regulator